MPNTLAHIGAQVLPWKLVNGRIDIKWLAVGCVIPDVPWIMQRITRFILPALDPLEVRIYFMIQASLFFCLLLGLAVSMLAQKSRTVFLVCASGSLLHLLLDAAQTKWANGVHFLAPLNWNLAQFELFWPEHTFTLVLTMAGGASLIYFGWRDSRQVIELRLSRLRLLGAAISIALYLFLPLAFFGGPIETNSHFVATLAGVEKRPGREIGFDRCLYDQQTKTIRVFTGEQFDVTGPLPGKNATISLNGRFMDTRTIAVESLHMHHRIRDIYSLAGLAMVLFLWLIAAGKGRILLSWPASVNSNRLS